MPRQEKQLHNRRRLKGIRRILRNGATPAEAFLWRYLKQGQLDGRKFRRQHSVGSFVVDFYCPAEHLAVELDGCIHDDPARHAYDGEREAYLLAQEIRILRFANDDVFHDPEAVVNAIRLHFRT